MEAFNHHYMAASTGTGLMDDLCGGGCVERQECITDIGEYLMENSLMFW